MKYAKVWKFKQFYMQYYYFYYISRHIFNLFHIYLCIHTNININAKVCFSLFGCMLVLQSQYV